MSSSHSAASSSSIPFAYMSSETRIFFALTNICFSPVERPFSWSRSDRFRTTSASSKMSPVFILSRLCLNRRFQFFGIVVPLPRSAFSTCSTVVSSMTFRRPTRSAFSVGTCTVMSLCRIWIWRYSRSSPSTFRFSFLTTVPAPWCGYTTLSPTLYKPNLPVPSVFTKPPAGGEPPANVFQNTKSSWKTPLFHAFLTKSPAQSRLRGDRLGLAECGGDRSAKRLGLDERHLRARLCALRDDHSRQPELRALLRPALGL